MNFCVQRNRCLDQDCSFIHPRDVRCKNNRPHDPQVCEFLHINQLMQQQPEKHALRYRPHQEFRGYRGKHGHNHHHYYGPPHTGSRFNNAPQNSQNREILRPDNFRHEKGDRHQYRHHHHHPREYHHHRGPRHNFRDFKGEAEREEVRDEQIISQQNQEVTEQQLAEQMDNLNLSPDIMLSLSSVLEDKGYKNTQINIALIELFQTDLEGVEQLLKRCHTEPNPTNDNQLKVLILRELGFESESDSRTALLETQYDLKAAISRLNKTSKTRQLLSSEPKTHIQAVKQLFELPPNLSKYLFVIDATEILFCNKHIRAIYDNYKSFPNFIVGTFPEPTLIQKVEGLLRLKTLLEPLVDGYFIIKNKFAGDEARMALENRMTYKHKMPVLMKTIETTTDKFAETVIDLVSECKDRDILFVGVDSRIVVRCADQVGAGRCFSMHGKLLVKQAKWRWPGKDGKFILKGKWYQ